MGAAGCAPGQARGEHRRADVAIVVDLRGGLARQDILVSKVTAGVDVRVILWANKNLLDNPGLVTRFGLGGFLNVTQSNVRAAYDNESYAT